MTDYSGKTVYDFLSQALETDRGEGCNIPPLIISKDIIEKL